MAYKVQTTVNTLSLREFTDETRGMLRMLAEQGHPLYWEVDGETGKLPAAYLRDAFRNYDNWQALKERHPEAEVSPQLFMFSWEQTFTPRDSLALEEARLLPLLHQERPHTESRRIA